MLTYTMDVEDRSRWIIATPSAAATAQPFFASEVGDFYARRRFTTARSDKNSFIVFYTLEGCGTVRQGGQEVLLEKGHALLMDCRTPQSYGTTEGCGRWFHLWTHVDGAGVAQAGEALGLPKLTPVKVQLSRIQPHFDSIFEHVDDESIASRAITGAAVHALLAELVVASQKGLASREDDPVRNACAFIDEHFAEDIRLEDMAQAAAVSPSHLIRLFKRQLGTTPHDYLLRRRITRAKELLAETTLTSAAIAQQVGFSSESSFSYRFTQMVGQGPRAWRLGSPR